MANFPYLQPECVDVRPAAADKEAVLGEIARLAASSETLSGFGEKDIFDALQAREEQSSTGLENGLAIPHCRLDGVSDFVVGVLLLETGVDFAALDGRPSRAFVFIIGPTEQRNLHIRILSSISRGLMQERARDSLMSASTRDELIAAFDRYISLPEAEAPREQSQMTIYIQSEDAFDAVMEIFSNPVYGSAMAVDAANAGRSWRSLPLFSAFWTDRPSDFAKVVLAIVPKAMVNEIIRKVNVSTGDGKPGVLVSVQDIAFVSGSLTL